MDGDGVWFVLLAWLALALPLSLMYVYPVYMSLVTMRWESWSFLQYVKYACLFILVTGEVFTIIINWHIANK